MDKFIIKREMMMEEAVKVVKCIATAAKSTFPSMIDSIEACERDLLTILDIKTDAFKGTSKKLAEILAMVTDSKVIVRTVRIINHDKTESLGERKVLEQIAHEFFHILVSAKENIEDIHKLLSSNKDGGNKFIPHLLDKKGNSLLLELKAFLGGGWKSGKLNRHIDGVFDDMGDLRNQLSNNGFKISGGRISQYFDTKIKDTMSKDFIDAVSKLLLDKKDGKLKNETFLRYLASIYGDQFLIAMDIEVPEEKIRVPKKK